MANVNQQRKLASAATETIDPFAEFYRQMEKKYMEILSGEEVHEYSTDIEDVYFKIADYEMTPVDLDNYLELNKGNVDVIVDIKAAIADRFGDLLETYRYESTEDGKALEHYIDQLLAVVKIHEITTRNLQSI